MASLCLLGGLVADRHYMRASPADAQPYHAAVQAAEKQSPYRVGMWVGTQAPVTRSAIALLHPNIIVSRSFRQLETGYEVTFLLVQCSDARDILGHFPPVCYRNQGYTIVSAVPTDWDVGDLTIHGMQYEFTTKRMNRSPRLMIQNFMILPNGTTDRDMDSVYRVARDRRTRFFGAAQVQLVGDATLPPEVRAEFLELIVQANRPLIDAIRHGVNP